MSFQIQIAIVWTMMIQTVNNFKFRFFNNIHKNIKNITSNHSEII